MSDWTIGKKQMVDYDFKAVTGSEFELTFDVKNIKNRMMNLIFTKSKAKLKERKGVDVGNKSPDSVENFEVNKHYLKLLSTIIKGMVKDVKEQVKADGIKILRHEIHDARFKRDEKRDWIVNIVLTGDYLDER